MSNVCKSIIIFIFVTFYFAATSNAQVTSSKITKVEDANSVQVTQSVEVAENSIIVTIHYENVSNEPILIMEGVWGIAVRGRPKQIYSLAEPEFVVKVDGVQLDYIGPMVKRYAFTKALFVMFQPKEQSTVFLQIADSFRFLSGKHEYEIVHHHLQFNDITDRINVVQSAPVKFIYDSRKLN
ncbi:hypothetical protein [Undibacterium curvum]|uniref:Uncharacterized protein n=1 Tax=Undibacterium curvum TaxID=2762294 RepID=A0ABR6ZZY0_9BURK|nr:hypothetical protein [Undibacterium curvum]MBC3930224.1 hypothetical protein [Undibacterium curvum]